MDRWSENNCSASYIKSRRGLYYSCIAPTIGHLPVREWAATSTHCRDVISAARRRKLKPSTVENYGTLMRGLVTLGRELRWINSTHNPMDKVPYRRRARVEGVRAEFVHERDRPDFEAVERLIAEYEKLADEVGIPWLAERAMVGAYSGARPSERDSLRICDLVPEQLVICIRTSFNWTKATAETGPVPKTPKNGKERNVPIPASLMNRLAARATALRAAGAAHDALLFADPKQPDRPISQSKSRRLHIRAAIQADWETVAVQRSPHAKRKLGPDQRPRHTDYSLRHHAATWMHHRAHFDWEDVSRYLGHHSVSFTHDVYVRSGASADSRNRERLANM